MARRGHSGIPHKRAVVRFGLAHHPTCTVFRDHVVVVRLGRFRAPVCLGCATFWPAFAVALPLLLWLAPRVGPAWWGLALAGVALGAVQAVSYARLARTRAARVAVKAFLAIGVAAVACAVVMAPAPAVVRLLAGVALAAAYGAVQTLRFRNILRACDACPWRREWQRCPGFTPFTDHRPGMVPHAWTGDVASLPKAWPW